MPLIFRGLLLIIVVYAIYSAVTWIRLDNTINDWSVATQRQIDGIAREIRQPADSAETNFDSSRESLDRIIEDSAGVCTPNIIIRWQDFLVPIDQSDCEMQVEKIRTTAQSLDQIGHYLEDEGAVAEILDTMAQGSSEIEEKEWQPTLDEWGAIETEIQSLQVSAPFEPTKSELLKKLGLIQDSWTTLISAHEKKNLAAFGEAKSALRSAYRGIGAVTENSAERLSELDAQFISNYEAAFPETNSL